MQPNEQPMFNQLLVTLCSTLRVEELNPLVKSVYWNALKQFPFGKVLDASTKFAREFKNEFGRDFPLPADFLAVLDMPLQQRPDPPIRNQPFIPNVPLLFMRIAALMPEPRHTNTEAQAEAMTAQMDLLVTQHYAETPPQRINCSHCEDSGYVWIWFHFKKGIRFLAGTHGASEAAVERVPNSPYWVTRVRGDCPMPDLPVTPCIARCSCLEGARQAHSIPMVSEFSREAA